MSGWVPVDPKILGSLDFLLASGPGTERGNGAQQKRATDVEIERRPDGVPMRWGMTATTVRIVLLLRPEQKGLELTVA